MGSQTPVSLLQTRSTVQCNPFCNSTSRHQSFLHKKKKKSSLTNEAVCAIFKIGVMGLLLRVMKLLAAWDNKGTRYHETRNSVLFSLNQQEKKYKTWEKRQHWHTRHGNSWARNTAQMHCVEHLMRGHQVTQLRCTMWNTWRKGWTR